MQFMRKLKSPNANTADTLRNSQTNETRAKWFTCVYEGKSISFVFFLLILTTRFRYY